MKQPESIFVNQPSDDFTLKTGIPQKNKGPIRHTTDEAPDSIGISD